MQVAVAGGSQCVDARRVLVVFVLPESIVRPSVLDGVSSVETWYLGAAGLLARDPISVHELNQVGLSGVLEDLGYVVEGRRHVAELVVGAVA